MPSLYELTGIYEELWRLAEQGEDGELDPDLEAALAENEDAIEVKVNGYVKVIRQLEYTAAVCKSEADRLTSRRKTAEAAVERLKRNLFEGMERIGTEKVKTDLFTATIAKCPPSVEVTNICEIPQKFFEPQPSKLLKSDILIELKSGNEVPGAELVTDKKSLRIR